MGLQVVLDHRTEYRYDKPVSLGPQVIQLRPAPHSRTPILSYSLTLTPSEHILNWQLDPHSNYAARVLILQKTSEFAVQVQLVADLAPINPFNFFLEPGFEDYPFQYSPQLAKDLEPYRSTETAGPRLQSFLAGVSRAKRGTIDFLVDLNRRVRDEVDYVTRLEPGVQSCEQTLELRSGSCRDSAWLFVQILRQLGIAARFVSGYLIQLGFGRAARFDRTAKRLCRPACLGRSVFAGRRMDWNGCDLGPICGRGPHPARVHSNRLAGGTDRRHCRTVQGGIQQFHIGSAFE